ncbi:hypothetical protein SUGI_0653980 [Cryptomeria japonica]|nr:hypothetical protein SUGI_0653980 [Cryptomeria japonica]
MAKRESEIKRAPETDETVNKAYKAGTQLQGGKLAEMDQVQLFNDFKHILRKPFREEEGPEVVEGIQQIGRGPNEVRDIAGKPITPEDARIIQKKEAECGFPTVKGSLSTRAQAAAAANVREHKVDSDAGLSATLR